MSRNRAARLAKFKIDHPMWQVRREEDGSYLAICGTTMIAAVSLERLAALIERAGPDQEPGDES